MNEDIVQALVTIGNAQKVKEICEPNIFERQALQEWMVIRTLKSLELFLNEWERYKKAGGLDGL